jgi:hypothetical protein
VTGILTDYDAVSMTKTTTKGMEKTVVERRKYPFAHS